MRSSRHLSSLNEILKSQVAKRASPGERVIGQMFPSRGSGYPGFWFSDRILQVQHFRSWVYVCIDLIAKKKASVVPNMCWTSDRPVKGMTVKACQRSLANLGGHGLGADPYVGAELSKVTGKPLFKEGTAWDARDDRGRLLNWRSEKESTVWGNPVPGVGYQCGDWEYRDVVAPVGFSGGGHSFLTMGEWRCLTDDTECLTDVGWKRYQDLTKETRIACYNSDKDALEYHCPSDIHVYDYDGEILHWQHKSADIAVTPNHTIPIWVMNQAFYKGGRNGVVAPYGRGEGRKLQKLQAKDCAERESFTILNSAEVVGECPEFISIKTTDETSKEIDAEAWAAFIGWYVSEGSCERDRPRFGICQRTGTKKSDLISSTLEKFPEWIKWRKSDTGGGGTSTSWRATDVDVYRHLCANFGMTSSEKKIPDYVKAWPAKLLKIFLDCAVKGDGSTDHFKHGARHQYDSTSKQLVEGMQEVATKCGYRCSSVVVMRPRCLVSPNGNRHHGKRTGYRVFLSGITRRSTLRREHLTIEHYRGKVWCVTVPTGMFVVRRNEKVHITGNSKALSVVKPHENLWPLENDHPLRRLYENPNPIDTPYDIAYERRMFKGLCGVAYEWTPKNKWGMPCERWIIPSHWVYPRTGSGQYVPFNRESADELIWDYEIRPWGYPGYAGCLHFPPDEVIVYRDKHPLSKIDGWSKLAAGAQVIDLEEATTQTQWSQMINQGVPGMMIKAPPGYEDWDDSDVARYEAKFFQRVQGAFNYGKPLFMPAGSEAEPWGYNPTEMAYQSGQDQARDRVLSLHGVTKAAIGLVDNMTYGCLDPQTQCLTDRGWVDYTNVLESTRIACYDADAGKLVYRCPSAVHVYDYKGKMHRWAGQRFDALMTPNHRAFVQVERGREHVRQPFAPVKAEDVPPWRPLYMLGAAPAACDAAVPTKVEKYGGRYNRYVVGQYDVDPQLWLEFLGYYISEGHAQVPLNGKERNGVDIAQRMDSVLTPKIQSCLDALPFGNGWRRYNYGDNPCYHWRCSDRGLHEHLVRNCGQGSRNKRIPDYVKAWPAKDLRILLDALIAGDGRKWKTGGGKGSGRKWNGTSDRRRTEEFTSYRTISKQLADDVMELAVKCGLSAFIGENNNGEDCITVNIETKTDMSVSRDQRTEEDYDGVVWCVTVPTGLFVVRRNGKAHVTGNSVMATLGTLHALVINPELTADGQTETKHLASQFDERAPAYSTMTAGGHGHGATERKCKIFYDDTVPADPQQVNSDLQVDISANCITPNEIRALRGRQPFRKGGDNPIVNGPGGPMPLVINAEEDVDEMAEIIAQITQAEGKQTGEQQTESDMLTAEARETAAEGKLDLDEAEASEHGGSGLEPPEETNGKPSKAFRQWCKFWVTKDHKFSSTQFNMEGDLANYVAGLRGQIADEDLVGDGKEGTAHVTVKYGLHTTNAGQVRQLVERFGPVTATLEGLGCFSNDGEDVVFVKVDSPDLVRLNRVLARLRHTDTHPDYKPHITLAYVRPGMGEHYANAIETSDEEVELTSLVFSPKTGTPTVIELASYAWQEGKAIRRKQHESANLVTTFPDVRQPNYYTCGASAFAAVCQHFGVGMEVERAGKLLGTNLAKSTDPAAIVRELRKLGIAAQPRKGMTIDDLHEATEHGLPVITCVQDYGERREEGASFLYGHYLTVLRCIEGVVTCQDSSIENVEGVPGGDVPARKPDPGNIAIPGRVLIATDKFEEVWHDQRANGEKLEHFGIVCGPRQALGKMKQVDKGFPTVQAAGKWLAQKWAALEDRYGRAGALSMAVAMLATSPLPGNIPAVIAAAEAVRGISGYFQRDFKGVVPKDWVTLEPSGTHVFIDGAGNVTAGPQGLAGRPVNHLSPKKPTGDTAVAEKPAEHKPQQSGAKQSATNLTATALRKMAPDYAKIKDEKVRKQVEGAVRGYYNGDFTDMNNVLRGRGTGESRLNSRKSTLEKIDAMKRAFDEVGHELPSDTAVYRVVNNFPFDATPGSVFQDKGFVSTTADKKLTDKISKGDANSDRKIFHIRVPKGTKVISAYGGEDHAKEVTLPAGCKFKVISSAHKLGRHVVELEVVQ